MYKVNIRVTDPDKAWIVGRLARELVARLPQYGFTAEINSATPAVDIEYHGNAYFPPSGKAKCNIALFAQEDGHTKWVPFFDGHVVLNPFMAAYVKARGAKDPVIIEQAVDEQFILNKKLRFGVAGSVKRDGRKGEHLVKKMMDAGYDIRAWGSGWPCPTVGNRFDQLQAFYSDLDYYVVTSTMEGGCTPIIECMAMGVPVISPRIGFAIVRPIFEYEKGSWESLSRVLKYLTEPRTYDDWAKDHADYFRKVMGGTN